MSKRSKKSHAVSPEVIALRESIAASFNDNAGNLSAVSRELGMDRGTIRRHLQKMGAYKKDGSLKKVAAGDVAKEAIKAKLPAPGHIKRYIITSIQNNTLVNDDVWCNIVALSKYYSATILVGTYSYNKNHFGPLAVKRGTKDDYQYDLWYDPKVKDFINDQQIELGEGLLWYGKMNIMPTDEDPLSGCETLGHRKSAIFPHTKIAMRSIATAQGEGTKLNYTTGTVTMMNYIQKKAGIKAEHHHNYGGLLVEVDSDGHWWVRQLDAEGRTGKIQDLDVVVDSGKVTTGNPVEAIVFGDIHATTVDPVVHQSNLEMLDVLKPRYQFIHDLLEGASVNHHEAKNFYSRLKTQLRGLDSVVAELKITGNVLLDYLRPGIETVVVNSNHDRWLDKWLSNNSPDSMNVINAQFYFAANAARCDFLIESGYSGPGKGCKELNITDWAMRTYGGVEEEVKFLDVDEPFTICNKRLEMGMHGHLGPDGARGSSMNLAKVGRRAVIGHIHSASIMYGLYVVGTSTTLKMGYNHGPSSWSHTHCLVYPNGKRTLVTVYAGKWRA